MYNTMEDHELRRLLETILDEVRQLKKLVSQSKLDPLNVPASSPDKDEELRKRVATFECPICGGEMKLRRRRSDNEPFMGCADYPDCDGLRDINGKANRSIYSEKSPHQRNFDEDVPF